MNLYRVTFNGNKAVSANQVYAPYCGNTATDVATINGKRVTNWLTIFADDERESKKVANKVVKEFLSYLQE